MPLNPKNELLLAHLCGDEDFEELCGDEDLEEQLVEYHSRTKAKKPKADPKSISSSRTLAGQSGDRKRKREGGENGDHQLSAKVAIECSSRQRVAQPTSRTSARRGVKAGKPATSRTSARQGQRLGAFKFQLAASGPAPRASGT
jgi:hypothetical protein